MAQNDFLVWAGGNNANVLTQTNYAGLSNRTSGVVSGKASGQQANKTWRQSSVMSAMIAKFIVDRVAADVIDDGTIQTIENNFIAAIMSLFVIPNTGVVPGAYGPTVAISVEADGRITSLQNANLNSTGLTPGTYVAPTITVGNDGRITGIVSIAYGPLAGVNTWTNLNSYAAGLTITGVDLGGLGLHLRIINGSYGAGIRNDGVDVNFLQTAAGQQTGGWNSLRPFGWHLASGAVTIDGTGSGVTCGGPVSFERTLFSDFFAGTDGNNQPVLNLRANYFLWYNVALPSVSVNHGSFTTGFYGTGQCQTSGYWQITGSFAASIGGFGYLIASPTAPTGFFNSTQVAALSVFCPNGSILALAFQASSDRRIKSDIQPLPENIGRAFVQSIEPMTYLKDGNFTTGFVAQDVIRAGYAHMAHAHPHESPDLAEEVVDDDGLISPAGAVLTLDHDQILAYHQSALRYALDEIKALKAEVASLRS